MNIENFQGLDIKDLVLIGGGLFTVVIISHGFWLAWRARKAPLRMEITPELIPDEDDDDDLVYLRGELPNGGARPVQRGLNFDAASEGANPGERAETAMQPDVELDARVEPPGGLGAGSAPASLPETDVDSSRLSGTAPSPSPWREAAGAPSEWPATGSPAGGLDDEPAPMHSGASSPDWTDADTRAESEAWEENWEERDESTGSAQRQMHPADERDHATERPMESQADAAQSSTPDLLVINLFAPEDKVYTGEALLGAMRNQGLKYGEMKIFHRLDQTTGTIRYSIANVVEPGHFDMAQVSELCSPGLVFFMRLPGSADPEEAVEDLLFTVQAIADELGAVLKDEHMADLTPQRMRYYRERVADYTRCGAARRVGAM